MYYFTSVAGSCTCDSFDIALSFYPIDGDRLYQLLERDEGLLLRPLTMSCESVLTHCS